MKADQAVRVSAMTMTPLSSVTESVSTWNPLRANEAEVFDYIDLSAVDQDAKLIVGAREIYCNEAPSRARQLVSTGDILVSTVRPNLNGVARVNEQLDGATASTGFCVIRAASQLLDSDYLFQWVKSPMFVSDMVKKATGASYPAVSDRIIFDSKIPLPPLAEQKRIAGILDAADALRAKRRESLAQLDALLQSTFLTLFGDPRSNEKNWRLEPIGSVVSDMRGGAALKPDDFVESGFPILHKGAIKAYGLIRIDSKKKTFAPVDYAHAHQQNMVDRDFMAVTLRDLVPSGPSIGFTADLKLGPFDRYLLAQGSYGFRVNRKKATEAYLVYLSNNENFRHVLRQNAVGSTQIHIRTPIYLSIKIPLPPLSIQQHFASIVEVVERQKDKQNAYLKELNLIFDTIQYRAFRGQL